MITQAMEYLTENAFSVYPFKDAGRLTPATGLQQPIPTNVFVDAQIVTKNTSHQRVFLYSLALTNSVELGAKVFQFVLRFTDADSAVVTVVTFEKLASSIVLHETITYTDPDGEFTIKLVPGPGMIAYHTANLPFYNRYYADGVPYLEFVASVLIPNHPVVNSVSFYNDWTAVSTGTLVGTLSPDIIVEEGANIDLINSGDNQVDINVEPELGTGLYNACTDDEVRIVEINSTTGNAAGDIIFTHDNCLKVTEGENSVQIEHTCEPKCSETDVKGLAYYINRIKDAMIVLSQYANSNADSVKNELFARMEEYKAKLETVQTTKAPFIEVEHAKANSATKSYISIAVGLYDPNRSDLTMNLRLIPDISLTDDPTTGWRHIEETAQLRENNNEFILPFDETDETSWRFFDRTINCQGAVSVTASFSIPKTETNRYMLFQASESTSAVHPGTSAKMHVVNPSNIYFTLKSKRVWSTTDSKYIYYFTIDLFKANLDASGVNTHDTTFSLSLPTGLTYIADTAELTIDNGTPVAISAPSGNMIASTSLNYNKRATITFEADYVPDTSEVEHTDEFTLSPSMSISGNSFTKTITIR